MSLAWLEDLFYIENENNISFKRWNIEAYQPILENGGSYNCFFRIRIVDSAFASMFSWRLVHTMQLDAENSFQIPSLLCNSFGLSMLSKTNGMRQIASLKAEMSLSTVVSSISLLVCLSVVPSSWIQFSPTAVLSASLGCSGILRFRLLKDPYFHSTCRFTVWHFALSSYIT